MLQTTVSFAKGSNNPKSTDALEQVLSSLRIRGNLLLNEKYEAPWAVSVPDSTSLNQMLATTSDVRIAAFHLVERGHINIKLENGEETLVEAGEMIICFGGLGHVLSQGTSSKVMPFQNIMKGEKNIFHPKKDISPNTSLICGVFLLHDTLLNPLLSALPNIIKLNVSSPDNFPRLYGIVNLLAHEFKHQLTGNNYFIQRYLEVLCAEAVRTHINQLPEKSTGWLYALKDPVIGSAIEKIHAFPSHNWSVKSLADEVVLSPSRFASRFTATLGESPMVYVTKWRMHLASQMLEKNQYSIDQIASNVGYENMTAFSRAFKRYTGLPPAMWRTQRLSM